jgi:hypothetical protein
MTIPVAFDAKVTEWAGGMSVMDVSAPTVQEALFQVARAYPVFRMFNCDAELRSILKVRHNGAPADFSAPLAEGDALTLSVG